MEVRKSKNAPQEISSKVPVRRRIHKDSIPVAKRRDPREKIDSDAASNPGRFKPNYDFLREYRQVEVTQLKEQLAMEKDTDERDRIARGLKSMVGIYLI